MLTHSRLLELLFYDPITGIFTWEVNEGKKVIGKQAGSINKNSGYVEIRIDNKLYYGHRLAWFYVYGTWPINQIDHKNNIRHINSLINLQEATQLENNKKLGMKSTNTSGYKGVFKKGNKFISKIVVNRKNIYIGTFNCPIEAAKAYDLAAQKHHATFSRTNKELGLV